MNVIIGIGNPLKGDDNIGNIIVQKIKAEGEKIAAETTPENHIAKMRGARKIVFIDAVDFHARPGTIKLFDTDEILDFPSTTHAISLNFFRKMIPRASFFIVGIQPKEIAFSQKISNELDVEAIAKDIDELLDEIL
jgi:hydrogenase maturation protease